MLMGPLDRLLWMALEEDLPAGDVTSNAIIDPARLGRGKLIARQGGVLAGAMAGRRVFELVDASIRVEFTCTDGSVLDPGQSFGTVVGPLRGLLAGERTALNLLQRLCGVATLTRQFVRKIQGTGASIVDTRKTTPAWRALEKAAVVAGGGRNHRSSLSDGVLIKTNHVRVAGTVSAAIELARQRSPHPLRIEVEVRDMEELGQAVAAKADVCLLDNMTPASIREAVQWVAGRCLLEASGGVTLDTVRPIAETGVDLISVGALTHSAPSVDLAFEVHG